MKNVLLLMKVLIAVQLVGIAVAAWNIANGLRS